ncbi:uncharacterized protein E5676_scaffold862G00160 [Cucumis melo var. makuwa]|uniref:Uncharacterized protein n=1 Tax=Cucumis melo var. makuwa TaxID=1194695 RepID=A0A5D3DQ64_CUCMM|nr:uncharacterized protein E6C27_scaffold285G00470 [Cucumis melo var. makuwa]TYK25724.1 uncharacterized protein E5676_scaffold862G00160 [Cucumis melo var. makuwa]
MGLPEVDDVENEQLNVLEIFNDNRVDEHIDDDTLCRTDIDPTIIERSVVCHVADEFIDDEDEKLSHQSETSTMSSFLKSNAGTLVSTYLKWFSATLWDEICKTVLGRRSGYSKSLGWKPKPKFHKTISATNASTLCS